MLSDKPETQKIQAQVHRTVTGLSVECRVHPSVEAFFRNLAGLPPQVGDIRLTGRYWVRKGDGPLPIYTIPNEPPLAGVIYFPTHSQGTINGYRLDRPGNRMLEPDPTGARGNIINMGFLRLQGISDGAGLEFIVKGVYSDPMVRQIYDAIKMAGADFVKAFLKPMHLAVTISTQEY